MWEKIVDILKEVLEKHFIPALCSVIPTAIIFYITPNNNSILVKLGKNFFLFVIFVIFFLLIKFFVYIFNFIRQYFSKYKEKQYLQKEEEKYRNEEEQEAIDSYLDRLDSLQPHLFDLIVYLVEHDNEPITIYGKGFLDSFELHGFLDYKQCKIKEESISSVDPYKLEEKCIFKKGDYVTQFKLKEDVYHDLLIIKKKYKKLTRF